MPCDRANNKLLLFDVLRMRVKVAETQTISGPAVGTSRHGHRNLNIGIRRPCKFKLGRVTTWETVAQEMRCESRECVCFDAIKPPRTKRECESVDEIWPGRWCQPMSATNIHPRALGTQRKRRKKKGGLRPSDELGTYGQVLGIPEPFRGATSSPPRGTDSAPRRICFSNAGGETEFHDPLLKWWRD